MRVIVTREGGLCALYKGIVPTMIGIAPYAGTYYTDVALLRSFPSFCQNPVHLVFRFCQFSLMSLQVYAKLAKTNFAFS